MGEIGCLFPSVIKYLAGKLAGPQLKKILDETLVGVVEVAVVLPSKSSL